MSRAALERLGANVPARHVALPSLSLGESRAAGREAITATATPGAKIEDNKTVTSTIELSQDATVDQLKLDLDVAHTYRGDLVVTLTSPSGKSAVVSNKQGGSADDLKGSFDLSAFKDEKVAGKWTLSVQDTAKADTGTLKSWGLSITPKEIQPPPPPPPPPPGGDPFKDLRDEALLSAVRKTADGKKAISYDQARRAIFTDIDVKDGKVKDVYTGRLIPGGKMPNSSDVNVEHTWPQSKGATGPAKSDLHHLFPTDSKANSTRSSFPFGKVVNVQWTQGGSKFGTDAQGRKVFEPPDEHKGNVARAMFYFSATYNKPIPAEEEAVLRQWNKLDVVDDAERARNQRISEIQGNKNQFVEWSNIADRIKDF
jgi:subtilisin-like proprotein convertase family protein